ANTNACNGDARYDPEHGLAKTFNTVLQRVQLSKIRLDDSVNIDLIGFAVFTVGVVVALLVGSLWADITAKADSFGAEFPEFGKTAFKIGKCSGLCRRHHGLPGSNQGFHGIEVLQQTLAKL